MRTSIIVTVKDTKNSFAHDVEVPVHISAQKAAADIVEVLNFYKADSPILLSGTYRLKNERTGMTLPADKTLYESGVWQGDVLILTELPG